MNKKIFLAIADKYVVDYQDKTLKRKFLKI